MKFFHKAKDGGPQSNVTGYWLIEWKGGFSVALLHFAAGYREYHHSHAFNALSYVFGGDISEHRLVYSREGYQALGTRRMRGFEFTGRSNLHRVFAKRSTWALTLRGPWSKTWNEYDIHNKTLFTLTNGRRIIGARKA